MPKQIARWNPARDAWEEETTGLFCEHSDVFSETWPSCGTTRGGSAYALPTPAHPTAGSASSSSPGLPTPTSRDYKNVGTKEAFERRRLEHPQPLTEIVVHNLPTPRASRGASGTETLYALGGERDDSDRTQGRVLLPTPTCGDAKSARNSTANRSKLPPTGLHAGDTLTDILVPQIGASTAAPLPDGRQPWDEPLPLPLN